MVTQDSPEKPAGLGKDFVKASPASHAEQTVIIPARTTLSIPLNYSITGQGTTRYGKIFLDILSVKWQWSYGQNTLATEYPFPHIRCLLGPI